VDVFLLAGLVVGGLTFNIVDVVSGSVIGALGVEFCTLLAVGFWLELIFAGALYSSPAVSSHLTDILYGQLPFAVIFVISAWMLLLNNGSSFGESLFFGTLITAGMALLMWVHIGLLTWLLGTSAFGTNTTAEFDAALDHPSTAGDLFDQSRMIQAHVHELVYGPTAIRYCFVAAAIAIGTGTGIRAARTLVSRA
jgi:hypothetical protein